MNKLLRFLRQHKSIMEYLIEEQEALAVSCQISQLHFLSHISKMTVRLHHTNCIIFYVSTPQSSSIPRRSIWNRSFAEVVRSELFAEEQDQKQTMRVGFESEDLEEVKEISQLIKENFKTMLHVKKGIISEMERRDELNYNIIEDLDFSRKQRLS